MRLSKHHGLGNDFLVVFDQAIDAPLARELCDRRTGVGADGLIALDGDLRMTLLNSDGSRAEVSGNGLRCLGQAIARREGVDTLDVTVTTDAGPRRLEVRPGGDDRTAWVAVEMGEPSWPGGEPAVDAKEVARVDVGNPHLVLLVDDPAEIDVAAEGQALEGGFPGGMNVEFVAAAADGLVLRVWERGAGVTEACGTGAYAAAVAARAWGLTGDDVVIHMPGGAVEVRGSTLVGPAVFVADIEVPWR